MLEHELQLCVSHGVKPRQYFYFRVNNLTFPLNEQIRVTHREVNLENSSRITISFVNCDLICSSARVAKSAKSSFIASRSQNELRHYCQEERRPRGECTMGVEMNDNKNTPCRLNGRLTWQKASMATPDAARWQIVIATAREPIRARMISVMCTDRRPMLSI